MRINILITLFAAIFFVSCSDNATAPVTEPGPALGETEFVSVALPPLDNDPHSEGPDNEWVDVLQVTRFQGERTLVITATPFGGLKVVDLTDPSNPNLVAEAPLEGRTLALHDLGDWVVVTSHRFDGTTFCDVVVVDVTDLESPIISSKLSLPGIASRSVLLGEDVGLIIRDSDVSKVVTLSISSDGQLTSTSVNLPSSAGYVTNGEKYLVLAERVFLTPTPTTSMNNAPSSESTKLTVFDDQGRNGSVTVSGSLAAMEIRGNVLLAAFESHHVDSNHTVRTFDITDPTDIQAIDNETVCCVPIFVADGMLSGGVAVPISVDGQFGTPQPSTVSASRDSWRLVDEGRRILVVEPTGESGSPGQITAKLYDIEDLGQTAEVATTELSGLGEGLSFQQYYVVENSVSIFAPDGTTEETGLIVVPYTERTSLHQEQGALQLFTFSSNTVTARGVILSYSNVAMEVIGVSTNTVALLTGGEIRVYDLLDPSNPQELSVLELAPTITNIFEFGSFLIRRHKDFNYNSGARAIARLTDRVEVVPADDIHGNAVATFDVPLHAALYKVGHLLVARHSQRNSATDVTTTVDIWDLSNPLVPVATEGLVGQDFSHGFGDLSAHTNNYRHGPRFAAYELDDALVFVERIRTQIPHSENGPARSWATVKLHLLDLSDPAQPKFGPVVDMGSDERVVSITADGRKLHVTTWVPWPVAGEDQEHIRHYLKTVDYGDLNTPTLSEPINIPGIVLHKDADLLATVDGVSVEDRVDATINRLRLGDGVATLEAVVRIANRDVHDVRFVAGHVLVSHTERWGEDFTLDITTFPELEIASQTAIPGGWMYVVGSSRRHMVYSGQQIVAVEFENSSLPTVLTGSGWAWGRQLTNLGNELLIAAGRHGIISIGGN